MSKKDKDQKGAGIGGIALATGIGALIGAAITVGAALFFSDDKNETKKEAELKHPPPVPTPTHIPTKIEDRLLCPISLEVMTDPVVTPYGHTYDRKNIEAYIEKFGIDPMTRKKLAKEELAPNYTVRELIEHFDQERITKEQKTKEEHDPSKQ